MLTFSKLNVLHSVLFEVHRLYHIFFVLKLHYFARCSDERSRLLRHHVVNYQLTFYITFSNRTDDGVTAEIARQNNGRNSGVVRQKNCENILHTCYRIMK